MSVVSTLMSESRQGDLSAAKKFLHTDVSTGETKVLGL